MSDLYPLKFEPILKEKVWGGSTLAGEYGKNGAGLKNIGESWEISAIAGHLSVVSNGFLAGNNIEEILEVYMGDITGDEVFERYSIEFPLLIKLIEAKEDLSVQVHPGNDLAKKRHNAYGKTEMWYILKSEEGAKIYTGFAEQVTRDAYLEALRNNTIPGILNVEYPEPGDVFFTPAGRVHAIGRGIVLAEIQQTSDITYRIYDWDRKNISAKGRELHTDLALDAIDFSAAGHIGTRKNSENTPENLVSCEFFTANILHFNRPFDRDYSMLDSFVIFICTEGSFRLRWEGKSETVSKGETILLPAMIKDVVLDPEPDATIVEIYIDTKQ
ncbi:MAG: type I phosphomannose isomerase catalytic subunit [Bacteroidales bacterium]